MARTSRDEGFEKLSKIEPAFVLEPGGDPSQIEDFTFYVDCTGTPEVVFLNAEFGDETIVQDLTRDGAVNLATALNDGQRLRAALPALLEHVEALQQELARKDETLFRNLLTEAIERVMPGMEGQTFADEEIAGEFCLRAKAALSPQADKEGE